MRDNNQIEPKPDAAQMIGAIASRQDKDAFAWLFAFYAPRIASLVRRLGGTPELGEELAQEALLTVWRKSASFDPARASASAWIFTIVRNLRIDRLRRQKLATLYDTDAFPESGESGRPDAILAGAEVAQRVHDALAELPEAQIQVVRLSFFEDRPHEEIARLLDLPLGTVKSRLRLAMGRLRKLLGDVQ